MAVSTINYKLISEEINLVLSGLYGKYTSEGRPTKRGGLRFLDITSNKTFGFEKTRETDVGNLIILSAPFLGALEDINKQEKLKKKIKEGPHSDALYDIVIRQSRDRGKETKLFVEVKYHIPTRDLLQDEMIAEYGEKYKMTNSKQVVRNILREFIDPFAKNTMDHLIGVIRKFE